MKYITLILMLIPFLSYSQVGNGITSAGGGGGGEIPNNELLISVTNTGTGLQLVDAGGTYVLPFSNFPFTANGMFDAANEGGTWAVENWTTSSNPSLMTFGEDFTWQMSNLDFKMEGVNVQGLQRISSFNQIRHGTFYENLNGDSFETVTSGSGAGMRTNLSGGVDEIYISVEDDNAEIGMGDISTDYRIFKADYNNLDWVLRTDNSVAGATSISDVLSIVGYDLNNDPIIDFSTPSASFDNYFAAYTTSLAGGNYTYNILNSLGNQFAFLSLFEGDGITFSDFFGQGLKIDVDIPDLLSTDAGQAATIGTDGKILVTGGTGADVKLSSINAAVGSDDLVTIPHELSDATIINEVMQSDQFIDYDYSNSPALTIVLDTAALRTYFEANPLANQTPIKAEEFFFGGTGSGLIISLRDESLFQVEEIGIVDVYVNDILRTDWAAVDGGDIDTLIDQLVFMTALNAGDFVSIHYR